MWGKMGTPLDLECRNACDFLAIPLKTSLYFFVLEFCPLKPLKENDKKIRDEKIEKVPYCC
jgi:hypothetical protein